MKSNIYKQTQIRFREFFLAFTNGRKRITAFFALVLLVFANPSFRAQPTDLFISEYVEGTSFNKAIELYNGTSAAIDLAAGQYVVELYSNGATTSTSLALTGTVNAGGVFILAHPQATLGVTPNVTTTVINFNGDDAFVLRKGGISGTVLDVFGQVGTDPGTNWGANDTSTVDKTLRRKPSICQGDVTLSNAFYPGVEWDGYATNTFTGLGSHSATCGATVAPGAGLSLSPTSLNFSSPVNQASSPQIYIVTGNSLTVPVDITAPVNFELSLNSAGPYTSSLSIPSASFSSATVTVYVRFTPAVTGTSTGIATHASSPYSANLNLSGVGMGMTTIAQIQGTAAASSYTNQIVSTSGVVTADFQGANELGGFFIQDPIGDGNPLSSEGIFVFNTSFPVTAGDVVTLTGTVEESFNKTRIKTITSLSVQSTGGTVTPVTVSLPFATMTEAERWEGMHVVFNQTLSVTEVYTLARYGEVSLSVNGRLFTPTNFVDPNDSPASGTSTTGVSNVSAITAQQDLNNRSRILLDDKSNVQNPAVVPYVDATYATLRCGSTVAGVSGIMDYDFSVYRIQPIAAPAFTYDVRPAVPTVGTHNVKAASFNVLNYFNGDGAGGGFPTSRGATTATEFARQRTKIIEAIKQIDADAIGLMEMENDGNGAQSAIQDLVDGLNTSIGAVTYTFVPDPTSANGGTGTDEIKVAMIYKPAVLTPTGSSHADNNAVHNRPPLAQTFVHSATQEKFSMVVNHFKSKSCTGSTGANADQVDGQSCYNDARKNQATALLTFISSVKTLSGDNDVLVVGDLNAYEQEDPMDVLMAGGMNSLLTNVHSYVFDGQSGSLDHALVSTPLLGQVSGAAKWHINADEPIGKDYNQEFNPSYMYDATPFRSSDHDPVLIGLFLRPSISISVVATSSVSCFGLATGAVTLSATGGDGPLTYSWSPSGGNTLTASGLAAGVYSVSVTDGTNTSVKSVTVAQPSTAVTSTLIAQTSASCNGGSNGSATIAAGGGTGNFTYSWTPAGGTASTAVSLAPGVYSITAKDANLCSVTKTLSISQPPAITISIAGASNVSCNGLSDGSASVAATGGVGAFTYSWLPAGGTSASISSVSAGNYTVIATDANLCSTTKTISITQPAAIVVNLTGSSSVSCNGLSDGTATISSVGGTGGVTFSWSPTGGTNASASGLAAGIYTVTVKDANLCSTSKILTITQPAPILVIVTGSSNVSCNGLSNGAATVGASGGAGSFTYSWSPLGGANPSASSLAAGIYTVSVKDGNSCSVTKIVTIGQPAPVDATTNLNGLIITANATSATYQWINCSTGNSTISGATGQSFSPVANGSYAVIITQNSCSDTSSCRSLIFTEINSIALDDAYVVYPNPTKNVITIKSTATETGSITLYNSIGQIVYSVLQNKQEITIDLSEQVDGVYFVRFQSGNKSVIKKVIKTN